MNRILITFMFFELSFNFLFSQSTDWSKVNLKSSPKQVIEQTLNDEGKEDGRIEYNFNPKGYLVTEIKTAFVCGKNAIIKSVFTYNDNQTL